MVPITGGVLFLLFMAQTFLTPNNASSRPAPNQAVTGAPTPAVTADGEAMPPLKVEPALPMAGRLPEGARSASPAPATPSLKKLGAGAPEKGGAKRTEPGKALKPSEPPQQFKPEKAGAKKPDVTKEAPEDSTPVKKAEEPVATGPRASAIEVEVPVPSYALTALSGGRAWIRVNDRQTVVVKKGDSVPGLGVVSQVDVDSSQVKFENAAPLTLDRSK